MKRSDLIYDWNLSGLVPSIPKQQIEFNDETLRDGLQSPTIKNPSINDKIKILHLMEELGIHSADIGLPGAGEKVKQDVMQIGSEITYSNMNIKPSCAARTVEADIAPIVEISQKLGIPICVDMFIGCSSIRKYAEDWSFDRMVRNTEGAVKFAKRYNLPVMYVTEDTTRAHPETIRVLYRTAIENGADRICICDTVGHATPYGIWNLIVHVKHLVKETNENVKIDFHGHSDRGLSLVNTMSAIIAGADRVHGCALGIGERTGNTSMDLLLVNLKLMGWIDQNLTKLPEYCQSVAEACDIEIPYNYPVFGQDAFRTGTGVHANAIAKALKKKSDIWLADAVYSGVPASMVGKNQVIEVGPMSGKSNIVFWLEHNGIKAEKELVEKIFFEIKERKCILTDSELKHIIEKAKVIE